MFRCPYPQCSGTFDTPGSVGVCPDCHRLSGRCPFVPQVGGRCRALNRPLARYCRYCQNSFQENWFDSALAAEPPSRSRSLREAPNLRLSPPEALLQLANVLEPHEVALELQQVAGRVWMSTSAGRYLLLEPFRTKLDTPLVRRPWEVQGQMQLRAQAGGVWLVLWCEMGLQALDLLPLDAPLGQDLNPQTIWTPPRGHLVVANPVLLRLPADPENPTASLDRALLWLTAGPGGPRVWTALLSMSGAQKPNPRSFPVAEIDKGGLLTGFHPEEVALVPAQGPKRDWVVVRSARRVCWIGFSTPTPEDPVGAPAVRRLMPEPAGGRDLVFDTGAPDMPGLAFIPAAPDPASPNSPLMGQVFVTAHRDGEERRELYAIDCYRNPDQSSTSKVGDGTLLALAGHAGNREFLCTTPEGLRRYNELRLTTLTYDNPLLRGTKRAQISERLAVCSGTDMSTNQSRWLTTLIDLQANRLVGGLTSKESVPAPLLLGSHLLAIERLPTGAGPAGFCLTRRSLTFTSQ